MDPSVPSPPSDPELLTVLMARVAVLERQVAALQASPTPAAPPPRLFKPLPTPLRNLVPKNSADEAAPTPLIPAKPAQSLENRLGSQVFNRVGILALLFATSWALKLAIEQGWIGPVARILIGLAAGAGLVLWSERFRRKGFPAFSYSLKAIGTGVLYLTLWAAFHLYHLLPASVTLVTMILVTIWNAWMAWAHDAQLLAAYALTGAFATPLLLSTGGDHEIFLFTYIAAIDICTLALVRWKPWSRLLLATLIGTVGFFMGWYARFYPEAFINRPVPIQPFALTVAFTLLFFVVFALPTIKGFLAWPEPSPRKDPILDVLIPLGNAAFASLALYSLLEDSLRHDLLPWLMVACAAAYLGLMRLQRTALSSALHLALAVIFLTVAIPLKASGHTLTIAWLVEGLALLWVSTRIPRDTDLPDLLTPSSVLRFLSFAGYTLGFVALFVHFRIDENVNAHFLNADLASALVGVAAFAGAAYLGLREVLNRSQRPLAWLPVAWSDFLALDVIGLLLIGREIASSDSLRLELLAPNPALANPDFFTALIGLATLAAATYSLARLTRIPIFHPLAALAAATSVLFNLATILTVQREISALWTRSAANLQRSLAISGFLMLYAALLLTLGFVKRSAFTRWQALILLVFTIAKVFLYDMSGLSQGYRVASFLGLGIVLMAVSFAYQKDWLSLRDPAPDVASPEQT